jgi:hypothetical protein
MTSSARELAQALATLGYLELFQRRDDTELQRLWTRPDAPAELRRLSLDTGQSALPRFLASEVLFERDSGWPREDDRAVLATLYAQALQQNLTRMANSWGLPGEAAGPVGSHVLILGPAAVPAFAALLSDVTELGYSGSKEALLGNSYHYRVQDVAAALVAGLLNVPYPVHVSPADRDRELDRLRHRLRT